MAEVLFDVVENSTAEQFGVIKRHARGCLATGLDTSAHPSEIMWNVLNLSGIPKSGEAHPRLPELRFNRILMQGVAPDAVRFQLIYETFNPAGPASAYYLSDDSYLGNYTTNLLPGSRAPIEVSYEVGDLKIPKDYVPMTIYRPLRAVNVTALIYGNPEGDPNGSHVGEVNNAAWRGLGVGYWLLSRYYTNYSKFQNYYQKELQAISRVTEDWSETGILQNKQTGRFASSDSMASEITGNLTLPYQYGFIGNTRTRGFVRVGPYPTGYFNLLFGFI